MSQSSFNHGHAHPANSINTSGLMLNQSLCNSLLYIFIKRRSSCVLISLRTDRIVPLRGTLEKYLLAFDISSKFFSCSPKHNPNDYRSLEV